MKKQKIFVAFLLSFSMMTTMVNAEDANLSYEGDAETFIKTTDTINAFTDMMPGEERSQSISLTNENYDAMKFFVKIDEAKLLNEKGNGNIVYDISFRKDGVEFYSGRIGGKTKAGKGKLTENYMLNNLRKGESTTIEMSIKIDATSMTNDYQGSNGNLGIIFSVEHSDQNIVVEIVKKIPVINRIPGVSTGDVTSIYGVLTVLMVCLLIIIIVLIKKRKGDKNETA